MRYPRDPVLEPILFEIFTVRPHQSACDITLGGVSNAPKGHAAMFRET